MRQMLGERLQNAQATLLRIKEAQENETKSAAGDKFETGREMMQQEANKAGTLKEQSERLLQRLNQIDATKNCQTVQLGALVHTNRGLFFISLSLGKIKVDTQQVVCMAANAPLAQAMLHKSPGMSVSFNGLEYKIDQIL